MSMMMLEQKSGNLGKENCICWRVSLGTYTTHNPKQFHWASHCRYSPGTMNITLYSTEVPSGLRPSAYQLRDLLCQLIHVSYSSFFPTSSPCLLSHQPPYQGPLETFHMQCPVTIHGGIHRSHPPCLPLRLFWRFPSTVQQQPPSSTMALPSPPLLLLLKYSSQNNSS